MATVSGIKVFKDSIKFPSNIFQVVDYSCPDEPKSTSYHSMIISPSLIYSTGIDFSGGFFTTVYDSDGWANTYYKTVDFGETEQTVDDVFFSWLDENIVKEPETKTIRTLTINGTVTTEWNGKPIKQITVDGVTYKMPETVEPALITFKINNYAYQAEEGMTWSEWVASSYNTGGYTESGGKIFSSGYGVVSTPAGSVDFSDVIDPNESYTKDISGGSSS